MREIEREIVSALIVTKDNKLLMGKKDPSKGGVYSDCWHIPGGGVDEDDKDFEAALKREVFEETNIDLNKFVFSMKLTDDLGRGESTKVLKTGETVLCHMKFNIFRVNLQTNSTNLILKPSDDLVELRWFDLAELASVKLTPPSIELFGRLKLI